ncbi:helix-turn-helix domain-containing protein [Mycolicibacter heraklionensis]|uniref:helix-turn-helix domain-containing protein n=1 Tax=Mycolicibacter heraklionensis TaxID=512402 RepID=UPI0010423B60|nr:helix-turn-helix domain-containing protein [Mycolicibacter heraklionensis]
MADIERFTASEAAEEYGISIAAICNWVRRGHLRPTGIDHRGCKTYRKADLEQVRSR